MTPQRNKCRETQQPCPQHDPNMQPSSSSSASSSLAYPPGYRFVPTDAELIYYYLKPFSRDKNKSCPNFPIHHANIYESNPQQLTAEYKKGNLTEWFFISERTKIKRNGTKQKRGDHNGGYWHAKAATKTIKAKKQGIVGYKTTLNYYVGKQPNGVRTNWLMKEYWLESSDHNNTVDYAICKIYLKPTAKGNMEEEDVEDLEEEFVQPSNVEYQQPQPQFRQPELDSHQPQRHDIAYQEPLQPQPLNTIYHHQSHNTESEFEELHQPQPLNTIHHHHQQQRHGSAYQEPHQPHPLDSIIPHQSQRHGIANQEPHQPQPLVTTDHHRPQLHDIAYQEPDQSQSLDIIVHHQSHQVQLWQATLGSHQTQPHDIAYYEPHQPHPIDTVQNQLPRFWPTPLDSYPPHCHDIQYPQPQPLDVTEYQFLWIMMLSRVI
ncbi:NAC transcription factor 29-like [Raphanus sativus]|uniref:NAC transcription factor 29-like n=1 Tax=Raphanus sativus TaxID=3726 RepID=A0A9W3DL24_RAPSA|nr:NAC transcription factor 29-like [Raphanus sativus]